MGGLPGSDTHRDIIKLNIILQSGKGLQEGFVNRDFSCPAIFGMKMGIRFLRRYSSLNHDRLLVLAESR